MAFNHPHKLQLKRSSDSVVGNKPYVINRRGRKIYKWDAYLSEMDPFDARKRDLWELAEQLEAQRVAAQRTSSRLGDIARRKESNLMTQKVVDSPSLDS